ncbi:MAG: hypothetical protein ACW99G_11400 [Candidatus Thorarchaeota archaeon]|jgi:hypothetical protein
MSIIITRIVRDTLDKKHILVVKTGMTVCGITKRHTTPSFGGVDCKICTGNGEPQKNGSHK